MKNKVLSKYQILALFISKPGSKVHSFITEEISYNTSMGNTNLLFVVMIGKIALFL